MGPCDQTHLTIGWCWSFNPVAVRNRSRDVSPWLLAHLSGNTSTEKKWRPFKTIFFKLPTSLDRGESPRYFEWSNLPLAASHKQPSCRANTREAERHVRGIRFRTCLVNEEWNFVSFSSFSFIHSEFPFKYALYTCESSRGIRGIYGELGIIGWIGLKDVWFGF